jgi:hypothetical protein
MSALSVVFEAVKFFFLIVVFGTLVVGGLGLGAILLAASASVGGKTLGVGLCAVGFSSAAYLLHKREQEG